MTDETSGDPWYQAAGVLIPGGLDALGWESLEDLQKRHDVDRAVARAVRMEPTTALAQAVQAGDPEMPALSPRHIAGLRSQFHLEAFWHVQTARPAVERIVAARQAGKLDTVAEADFAAYNDSQDHMVALAAVQLAEPFFLPGSYAAMICESDPPDPGFLADIRLPYPTCSIWFARPLIHDNPDEWTADWEAVLVAGIVLAADPASGTGLFDPAILLTIGLSDKEMFVAPAMIPSWRETPNAGEIANAAAAIASMPFTEPPAPPVGEPLSSQWRKALKHGPGRRAAEAGAITGLRVLDLGQLPATSRYDPGDEGDYLRSPHGVRPHWRKGHWRRARLAHRDDTGAIIGDVHGSQGQDWDYRLDWIKPKRVNARLDSTDPADVVRIYRAQPPAESA